MRRHFGLMIASRRSTSSLRSSPKPLRSVSVPNGTTYRRANTNSENADDRPMSSPNVVEWLKFASDQIQDGGRTQNCVQIGILTLSSSPRSGLSPKVCLYQRLGPRLRFKYGLRHLPITLLIFTGG